MRKARTLLAGAICLLMAGLTVQALSQTRSVRRPVRPRAPQRKRTSGTQAAQSTPRSKQKQEQRLKKRRKEALERDAIIKAGCLQEKAAINPTPEQWELIKPLLEKIRQLRDQPKSTARVSLTSNSTASRTGSRRPVATWQWTTAWEDKPRSEWTEGQRKASELIALVGNRSTGEEAFARKTESLRECRRQEAAQKKAENIEAAIAETQQQLRALLRTRQEAALVLMRWL